MATQRTRRAGVEEQASEDGRLKLGNSSEWSFLSLDLSPLMGDPYYPRTYAVTVRIQLSKAARALRTSHVDVSTIQYYAEMDKSHIYRGRGWMLAGTEIGFVKHSSDRIILFGVGADSPGTGTEECGIFQCGVISRWTKRDLSSGIWESSAGNGMWLGDLLMPIHGQVEKAAGVNKWWKISDPAAMRRSSKYCKTLRVTRETFQDWLMFRDDEAGASWIPLARGSWWWSGQATWDDAKKIWEDDSSVHAPDTSGCAAFQATDEHPQWTDNMAGYR